MFGKNSFFFKVVDNTKNCAQHFTRVDQFCESITLLMMMAMVFSAVGLSVIEAVCSTAYCYFRDNHLNPKCLYIPYKLSLYVRNQLMFI